MRGNVTPSIFRETRLPFPLFPRLLLEMDDCPHVDSERNSPFAMGNRASSSEAGAESDPRPGWRRQGAFLAAFLAGSAVLHAVPWPLATQLELRRLVDAGDAENARGPGVSPVREDMFAVDATPGIGEPGRGFVAATLAYDGIADGEGNPGGHLTLWRSDLKIAAALSEAARIRLLASTPGWSAAWVREGPRENAEEALRIEGEEHRPTFGMGWDLGPAWESFFAPASAGKDTALSQKFRTFYPGRGEGWMASGDARLGPNPDFRVKLGWKASTWILRVGAGGFRLRESWRITARDGTGDPAEGIQSLRLRVSMRGHRVSGEGGLRGETGWAKMALGYAAWNPLRPPGTHWLGEAGQAVSARLRACRDRSIGLSCLQAEYFETAGSTYGRQIHPESGGLKRFHTDHHRSWWAEGGFSWAWSWMAPLSHATSSSATQDRADSDAAVFPRQDARGWKAEIRARTLHGRGEGGAPENAWDTKSETLHYNRLGLDALASVFGAFYGQSEWVVWDWRAWHAALRPELAWERAGHRLAVGVQVSRVLSEGSYHRIEAASSLGRLDTLGESRGQGSRVDWGASPSFAWSWRRGHFVWVAEGFQWIPVGGEAGEAWSADGSRRFRWPGTGTFFSLRCVRDW